MDMDIIQICGSKEHRKMDCGELPEERRKELQVNFLQWDKTVK